MKPMLRLFLLITAFAFHFQNQTTNAAETQNQSKPPVITYFIGRIEIVYPEGRSIIIKTGETAPALEAGTLLKVLDGSFSVEISNREGETTTHQFSAGETARVTLSQGNWQVTASNPDTTLVQTNVQTNLSSPGNDQLESEIRGEETPTPPTTPVPDDHETTTSVSPS